MKPKKTKDIILDTASQLFYNKGYNLIGINEIIEKAGIAKATLYSHYKSKEELCLAYLDKRDSDLFINLEAFCNSKPKGNKRLVAIIEFLLDFFSNDNFNGCWCLRTLAEVPPENEKIRSKIKTSKLHFLNFINQMVEENFKSRSKVKKQTLSKSIYMLYEGAVAESHLHNEIWPIRQNIDILKTLLKNI